MGMPGIFNSIDVYGKNIIHAFFDEKQALPPWYPNIGNVTAYVPSKDLHWSRFMFTDPKTRITLRGTPDDLFRLSNGSYYLVDYKTAKATATQDHLYPLYEVQLNVYAYISSMSGLSPISGLSLIYMEPETYVEPDNVTHLISEADFSLRFTAKAVDVKLDTKSVIPPLLVRVREIFDRHEPPPGNEGCEDCRLLSRLLKLVQSWQT